MLTKTLIAGATAASLFLSPVTATPAQAGDAEDVVQALVGIAALLVIADAIDGNDNNRVVYKKHRHTVLPRQCERVVQVYGKTRHVVVRRCLNHHGVRHALPKNCKMPAVSQHFGSPAFRVGCLNDHGIRLSRR